MTSSASSTLDRPLLVALRALKLGDFLTGLPALRALEKAFPGHRRVLAAPGWLSPLAHQALGGFELCPTDELSPIDGRLAHPDVAVDLHGRGPLSQPLLLELEPERLVAFEHPEVPDTRGMPKWSAGEYEVRRWCRLLEETGIPADPSELGVRAPNVALPAWAEGATVIHPGAAHVARRWPLERFAEIARRERATGREVVVTGSKPERTLALSLAELANLRPERVVAGRTGLLDLLAVVAGAGLVVSGDTGVAHMATATSTPSVVLFGPVSPGEWGPPPGSLHDSLWAGDLGDPHGETIDPGLLAIGVEQVWHSMQRVRKTRVPDAA